jgi:copper(I)-binding protein
MILRSFSAAVAALTMTACFATTAQGAEDTNRSKPGPHRVSVAQHVHDKPMIEGAYVRQPAVAGRPAAAYMTITNPGKEADRLVSASTPLAGRTEIHGHEVDAQGVARMFKVPGLDLPPGESLELKPGGYHVMLMELEGQPEVGVEVSFTLVFERSGALTVMAPVVPMGGQPQAHGHKSHGGSGQGAMDHGTTGN